MKHYQLLGLVFLFGILYASCDNPSTPMVEGEGVFVEQDSVLFSFAFVGCNRVDRHDAYKPEATDASTANLAVLDRIFEDLKKLPETPDLFFFLGDLVLGETDTTKLNTQLSAWQQLYENKLRLPNMELVAVPGNHETLTYKCLKHDPETGKCIDDGEFPLAGATDVWLRYMQQHMPTPRNTAPSNDTMDNRLSFSFVRGNVGFVVMNTDTYNPPSTAHPHGAESRVPVQWINTELARLQANPKVEHLFVLGHKPHYVGQQVATGHLGIHNGAKIWSSMEQTHAHAMLSAHVHEYQRSQINNKVTQVIAGNGGSKLPQHFGYSLIHIMSSGKVAFESRGYQMVDTRKQPYYAPNNNPFMVIDSAQLNWANSALSN